MITLISIVAGANTQLLIAAGFPGLVAAHALHLCKIYSDPCEGGSYSVHTQLSVRSNAAMRADGMTRTVVLPLHWASLA